jgi:hypothetical protein
VTDGGAEQVVVVVVVVMVLVVGRWVMQHQLNVFQLRSNNPITIMICSFC